MLERMKEIIAEQLNTDAAAITEESSFKDDLGADSLDLFEMVTFWAIHALRSSRVMRSGFSVKSVSQIPSVRTSSSSSER